MATFKIAGLEVTILGRQFPNAQDYWDGNWLNISARCESGKGYVSIDGPILHLPEIALWLKALKQMNQNISGDANLEPMEPNLAIEMTTSSLGQINLVVHITPDHLTQKHRFSFEIDQSYMGPLIEQIETILREFPIKEKPQT